MNLKSLWKKFVALFKPEPVPAPSVAAIMASFNEKVLQLKALNEAKVVEVAGLEKQIDQANKAKAEAKAEAEKALQVAAKIEGLLG